MLPVTRDLARRLLAYETTADQDSEPSRPAAFRVYEKLRRQLCALVGVAGFQSLVSRALTLAKAEAPSLRGVQVTADGSLQGFGTFDPQTDTAQAEDGEVILVAEVLGLLLTFVGEALTLRLVRDVWPDAAFDSASGTERKV